MYRYRFRFTIDFISIFHCKGLTTCSGSKAQKASELYKQYYKISDDACPQPCHNVIFYIGYPVIHKRMNKTDLGLSRIYFKKIVKVSEDFVSYDLLRYQDSNEIKLYVLYFFPSMVAEIGGYSGLLIGFSLMDIATIFKSFRLYFK